MPLADGTRLGAFEALAPLGRAARGEPVEREHFASLQQTSLSGRLP